MEERYPRAFGTSGRTAAQRLEVSISAARQRRCKVVALEGDVVQPRPLPFQEAADGRIASERLEQFHLGAAGRQVCGAHSLGWNVLGMPQLEAQGFPQR